jgi:hypothetical protein
MKVPSQALSFALLASALSLICCGGDDSNVQQHPPPACAEDLNVDCDALSFDPPVYSRIYRDIVLPQCALGSNCHGTDAAMGGLMLVNADDTYDMLLGHRGGTKRVLPSDPKCSPLMVRLESRDPNFQMPRGRRLSEPELCVFVQWIKHGAQKD